MSDNKDYITQKQEHGNVYISEEVIATIAATAVREVEGVSGLYGTTGSDIAGKLAKKKNVSRGIRVTLGETTVMIECNVVTVFGKPVVDIAKNVQTAVVSAVESMTGLKVTGVHVNVCGIALEK